MTATLSTTLFKLNPYTGETMVSAKELLNYFEVIEDLNLWGLRTLLQFDYIEDYFTEYESDDDLPFGTDVIDHWLTIECAKTVSLQTKSKTGRMSYEFLLQLQKGEMATMAEAIKLSQAKEETKELLQAKEKAIKLLQETSTSADGVFEQDEWPF